MTDEERLKYSKEIIDIKLSREDVLMLGTACIVAWDYMKDNKEFKYNYLKTSQNLVKQLKASHLQNKQNTPVKP